MLSFPCVGILYNLRWSDVLALADWHDSDISNMNTIHLFNSRYVFSCLQMKILRVRDANHRHSQYFDLKNEMNCIASYVFNNRHMRFVEQRSEKRKTLNFKRLKFSWIPVFSSFKILFTWYTVIEASSVIAWNTTNFE